MKIPVETSARHLHVSRKDLDTLFGEGFTLSVKKMLSQPGQFATNEKVTVVGPKGQLAFSILGPERPETQIEVSFSDARALGIVAPVRESGNVAGTPGCKLVGPCGEVELTQGVMVAKRHLHVSPDDAKELNVENGQIVSVKIDTAERSLTFGEVVVRVSPNYATAMHIDTDESNAAGCGGTVEGEIV